MKFLIASAVLVALAHAKEYPITGTTVNCREKPTTDSPVTRTYKKDDKVTLTCQVEGEMVSGTAVWDKTTDDCFVTDYFVKTDSKKFVADNCNSASGSASSGTATGTATGSATGSSTAAPTGGHGNSTASSSKVTTSVAVPTGGNVTTITTTLPPAQTTQPGQSGTTTGGAATSTTASPGGAAVLEKGLYIALPVALAAVAQLL